MSIPQTEDNFLLAKLTKQISSVSVLTMTTEMPPPPPKNPSAASSSTPTTPKPQPENLDETSEPPTAPPPPKSSVESEAVPSQSNGREEPQPTPSHDQENPAAPVEIPNAGNSRPTESVDNGQEQRPTRVAVPYTIPEWSGPPGYDFSLEVLKEGSIVDQLHVHEKGAYMFGRVDLCDFVLEHPTISRFHAVLQFKRNGGAYIQDLGSTHGTFINKNQVKPKVFVDLHVGDVIRFGQSTRLYILQGPSELMPPERDLKSIKNSKMREEMQDREASLLRAKREASIADGVSWGMGEDAIEETEEDDDEINWQNYRGQLTEKQEKTRDKVIKRLEKIANMKKEIDAIRAKDISQGGLTQGQQTQIARNEQRIAQIMEELENFEETLNESIRESLGARVGGMSHAKKKGVAEDEEEYLSDEDDFFDRTKKKASKHKGGENQSIETADSLLDKKDALTTEIEGRKKLLLEEKDRMELQNAVESAGDALDAYMSGLSSQLVLDKTEKLQNELSNLQSELDRIVYLLKIADPAGDAARKRESNSQDPKPNLFKVPSSASVIKTKPEPKRKAESEKSVTSSDKKQEAASVTSSKKEEEGDVIVDKTECKATEYIAVKPQWLGAVQKTEIKETQQEGPLEMQESDQFVDYKDRKKALENQDATKLDVESGIENAAPGLIIRKRKQVVNETKASEQSTVASEGAESRAEDAVALLLKHKRGYHASDEAEQNTEDKPRQKKHEKDKKKRKRVLGPERPSFLNGETDLEAWVPPEGQSGDGRTSLNERYGY